MPLYFYVWSLFVITQLTRLILEKANYEAVELPDNKKRKVIVSKNSAAVLAIEIVEDTATATNIFEYNHFAIKGYLEGKRRILNAIATYVEPMLKVKNSKIQRIKHWSLT